MSIKQSHEGSAHPTGANQIAPESGSVPPLGAASAPQVPRAVDDSSRLVSRRSPAERWRVGNQCARNLYSGQTDVGRLDTPELAALVVAAVNRHLEIVAQLADAEHRKAEPLTVDSPPAIAGSLRTWGTAADTVVVAADEEDADSTQRECPSLEVVYRWPTGPWLTEDGRIWHGDPQILEALTVGAATFHDEAVAAALHLSAEVDRQKGILGEIDRALNSRELTSLGGRLEAVRLAIEDDDESEMSDE